MSNRKLATRSEILHDINNKLMQINCLINQCIVVLLNPINVFNNKIYYFQNNFISNKQQYKI